MINPASPYDCCGCEACVQACPVACISFAEDEEGFRYPKVNADACTGCGLCERVCPMQHKGEEVRPLQVFAARSQVEDELKKSSSGGIFAALAHKVLNSGGAVCAAGFNEDFSEVRHIVIEDDADLQPLMGSKYLQSRIGNSFKEIKSLLEGDREVLFCGTSCQVKALRLFLHKDYEKLLTVDIVCHGVPSPAVWRNYLSGMGRPQAVSFRDKRSGWTDYSVTYSFADRPELSQPYMKDDYIWLFLHDCTIRPSCFLCNAKGGRSGSDLTLGDYWGIESAHPEFYDERGVSLVLVHSEKGLKMMEGLRVELLDSTYEAGIRENPSYLRSKQEPASRARFFRKFKAGRPVRRIARRLRMRVSIASVSSYIKRKLFV